MTNSRRVVKEWSILWNLESWVLVPPMEVTVLQEFPAASAAYIQFTLLDADGNGHLTYAVVPDHELREYTDG